MSSLLKNTAGQHTDFCLVVAATGAALTGATVTVYVDKDGTQTVAAGSVTELKTSAVGYGAYSFAPTQADTNAVNIGYLFVASTAVPVFQSFHTDDTTVAQVGVNVVNWNGTVVASPATAGIPDINVKNMNNVAATAITTIK